MYDQSTISISQIANGFLVTLPYMFEEPDQIELVKTLTRVQRDVLEEDKVLQEIQGNTTEPKKKPSVLDLKNDRVHYCKNYKAVLALLATLEETAPNNPA